MLFCAHYFFSDIMAMELSPEAQELYDELTSSRFDGATVDAFVSRHGEAEFIRCSQDYFYCVAEYGFDAVEAFIEEFGVELFDADHFMDSYMGHYSSKQGYVEPLSKKPENSAAWQNLKVLDSKGSVDWDASFDALGDYIYHPSGHVFCCNF